MAHFAKLDSNNIVEQVIVVNNADLTDVTGTEVESIGIAHCQKLYGASTNWKQVSYNNKFRGNYAGVGYTYMTNVATLGVGSTDIFINQQPYPSWSIGVATAAWYSPLGEMPDLTDSERTAGKRYFWDEAAYQGDNTVGWALTTT